MTILSKKKSLQGKQEVEATEATAHHGGNISIPLGSIPNHTQIPDRSRDERLSSPQLMNWPPDNDNDYEGIDSGPSHSKRRLRASPLRSARTTIHWDVNTSSPKHTSPSCSTDNDHPGPSNSEACGYNSGDEYDFSHKTKRTEAQWIEEDRNFEKKMRKRGFLVKKMGEDGACLFRAVADQVYGDQDMHGVVRKHCMDYIALNSDYFSQYVTEDFDTYVNRKRLDCTHGNHIEMQAMSEMYNRTIEVFCYGKDPINIFHGVHQSDNEPIRLSYQRGSHYNSIVDPHKATIGVGLGLPSFNPGSAEKNLLNDAIRQSEELQIEQAMLEDKLRATDWEATNEAIEEQVARDSYLQYLRDNEKRDKENEREREIGTSSTAAGNDNKNNPKPSCTDHCENEDKVSLKIVDPSSSYLSPHLFGLADWEDAGLLAEVLAVSQQEYLDNLKKSRSLNGTPNDSHNDCEANNLEKPSTSQ